VLDPEHNARLNSFDLVTPDGQPVRWALNLLHRTRLSDRVYGPQLTLEVLRGAAEQGLPVYLYGTTDAILASFRRVIAERFPALTIAGSQPSRFRTSEPGEADRIAEEIRGSGARLVLVGLGCPRQEQFAHAMRPLLDMPLLAVGAAFTYHAGLLATPPPWMQRRGLEWLWRLGREPLRLWRRYLLLNPAYLAALTAQRLRLWRATPPPPTAQPRDPFPV
jgi:exopolysaccharide biosynthesis WecB/TagA/CpsF family protein